MKKHLYVIRHGETGFNKTHRMQGRGINASLNEKGVNQAESISKFLKDQPITKIVTSSLNRAIESAQPICEYFKLQAEMYEELDEMDFGFLEGKLFEEVKEHLKNLHTEWSSGNLEVAPKDGENPIQVLQRGKNKMIEILRSSDDKVIVFMLHGRLIRILLSEFLGLGLKNMHQIEHQNGAINHITWDGENFEAVELNIIHHLDC